MTIPALEVGVIMRRVLRSISIHVTAGAAGASAGATRSGMSAGAGAGAPVGADGTIPGGDHASTTHGGTAEASDGAMPAGAGAVTGVIRIGEDSDTTHTMDTTTATPTIAADADTIIIHWLPITFGEGPIWVQQEVATTYATEAIADAQISIDPAPRHVPARAIAAVP